MRFLMIAVLLAGLPAVLWAVPNEYARFALHVKAPLAPEDTTPFCGPGSYSPNEENLPCSAYTVTRSQLHEWPGPVVYLMVGHADSAGISGVSFGVAYSGGTGTGIDPQWVTWTGCTDGSQYLEDGPGFHPYPWPYSGARITWLTCQNQVIGSEGVHVVVGAFTIYAYSAATFEITQNEPLQNPDLKVVSCDGQITDLLDLAPTQQLYPRVQFGGVGSAFNPCWGASGVPARATTWGRLKRQYGN